MTAIVSMPVDWTAVLIYGVPGYIAALFAGLAALRAGSNARDMRPPSGGTIGEVVERTHDLAAVNAAALTGASGPVVQAAKRRLNGNLDAPANHQEE